MSKFSFFDTPVTVKEPTRQIEIREAIMHIQGGVFKLKIENCRKFLTEFKSELESEDEATAKAAKRRYQKLKASLPSYIFSGAFKTLDSTLDLENKLIAHSGFIALDIDDIIEINQEMGALVLEGEKERYANLSYVYAVFISPSGTGLKVICKISPKFHTVEGHAIAFDGIIEHIKTLGIPDNQLQSILKCRDITRRCFTSFDEDIYINVNAEEWDLTTAELTGIPASTPVNQSSVARSADGVKCKRLANQLHELGIDITPSYPEWVDIALSLANLGEEGREIFHIVSSVYKGYDEKEADAKFTHCLKTGFSVSGKEKGITLGTFIRKAQDEIKKRTPAPAPSERLGDEYLSSHMVDTFEELIDEVEVGDADNPDCPYVIWKGNFWQKVKKIKPKTGEVSYTWNMDYVKFRRFLERAGFYKLVTKYKNKANTFEYVKVESKVIKSVRAEDIENYVMEWVRHNELDEVENKLTQGSSRYFSEHTLRKLSVRSFDFIRDTKEEAYYYFRNCFVRVTATTITTHPLTELNGYIWYSQIIDKDFIYTADNDDSIFNTFLHLATNGKRNISDNTYTLENGETPTKRITSVITGIGYALHGYKDPTKAKSFNIFDAKISRDKRPEGRSGKSLTFKAIGQVIPTVEIDATNIKINDNLTLSEVSHDTRFIYFNDANESFPFIRLFHMLTENMTSKRLYLDPIIIPFSVSPKIGVNTNWVLKGDGGSYRARQHNVEFTDFFSPEYSPRDHFNCTFFSDEWNTDEWNKFYSSMFDYVSFYLGEGLINFPTPNIEYRKLLASVSEEFVIWYTEDLKKDTRHEKKSIYEQFKNSNTDFENVKQNTFSRWLQRCADHFGHTINKGLENARDRVGGVDFITISTY